MNDDIANYWRNYCSNVTKYIYSSTAPQNKFDGIDLNLNLSVVYFCFMTFSREIQNSLRYYEYLTDLVKKYLATS